MEYTSLYREGGWSRFRIRQGARHFSLEQIAPTGY